MHLESNGIVKPIMYTTVLNIINLYQYRPNIYGIKIDNMECII